MYLNKIHTDKPNLSTLMNFGSINIMQRVVPKYKQLGNILLEDPNGVRVMAMEMSHAYNVDDVVYGIFREWLEKDTDATWSKLVKCLKKASLDPLAQEIESCLKCTPE